MALMSRSNDQSMLDDCALEIRGEAVSVELARACFNNIARA